MHIENNYHYMCEVEGAKSRFLSTQQERINLENTYIALAAKYHDLSLRLERELSMLITCAPSEVLEMYHAESVEAFSNMNTVKPILLDLILQEQHFFHVYIDLIHRFRELLYGNEIQSIHNYEFEMRNSLLNASCAWKTTSTFF